MIKKIFIAVFVTAFLTSCASKSEGYELTAALQGDVENGTDVYLKTTDSLNQLIDVDTTQVQEGSFNFSGKQDTPQLYYVFVDGLRG